MRTGSGVVALTLVCLFARHTGGQTARQGSGPEGERFRSPMIVEAPLASFDDAAHRTHGWRQLAETTELSRFVCEGISVAQLSAQASEKVDGENRRSLDIALTMASRRNEDKEIDLVIEFVRDGQVLASTPLRALEVEEGKRVSRQLKWKVRSEDLTAKPAGLIRVTVAVPGTENVPAATFVAAPSPTGVTEETAKPQTTGAPKEIKGDPATAVGATTAAAPSPGEGVTCRTLISEGDVDKVYYVPVKEISVSKKFYGSEEEMYGPLAEKARKIGADAVLSVHTWHAVSGFAWAAPHAGGMAVRWTEAGRKALHSFPGRCY